MGIGDELSYLYIMEIREDNSESDDIKMKLENIDPFIFFTIMMGVLTVKSDSMEESEE